MTRKPAVTLIQITALLVAGCSAEGPSERVMPTTQDEPEPKRAPIVEYTVNTGSADETAEAVEQPLGVLETVEVPAEETAAEAELDLPPEQALVEGRRAWEAGEYERAAEALTLAVDAGAGTAYEGYLCGLSLWKAGQPAEAEPYLVDASWKMPEFVRGPVNLARVRIELGQLAEAEEAIDTALAVDDAFGPAHNVRGRILLERGAVDEALEAFRRAAELDGDDPWPLNNAGYALLMRGEHAQAVEPLEQATGRSISQGVIWNNLALAREGAGDLPGAVEAAARAAELQREAGSYHATYERLAALVPAEAPPSEKTEAIAEGDADGDATAESGTEELADATPLPNNQHNP
jgi:tetratricopeptide (TPR) repeat protein